MAYTGLCCQPVPPGKAVPVWGWRGAGPAQLRGGETQSENEMQDLLLPPCLSVTSTRSWLGCFLPQGRPGHVWRKEEERTELGEPGLVAAMQ